VVRRNGAREIAPEEQRLGTLPRDLSFQRRDHELVSEASSLLAVREKGLPQHSHAFELEWQGLLLLLHFALLVQPLFPLVGTRMCRVLRQEVHGSGVALSSLRGG
jgi:hypothetical protein